MAAVVELPAAAQALVDEAADPATSSERLLALLQIARNHYGELTAAGGANFDTINEASRLLFRAVLGNPTTPREVLLDFVRSPPYAPIVVRNPILPLVLLVDPPDEREAAALGGGMAVVMQKAASLNVWWPAMTAWETKRRVKSKLASARSILSNRGDAYLHRYLVDASLALRMPRLGGMARALLELDAQRALTQHTVSARPYVAVAGTELWMALGGGPG